MAQWAAIGLTALFGIIALAELWGKLTARMDNIDTLIVRLEKYHDQHFESIRVIETMAASVGQELRDHALSDRECFSRIEDMFKETRADTKELLQRIPNDKGIK